MSDDGGGIDAQVLAEESGVEAKGGSVETKLGSALSSFVPVIPVGKRDRGRFDFKHFTLRHDLCGMKIGTDAVLLAGYAGLDEALSNRCVWEDWPYDAKLGARPGLDSRDAAFTDKDLSSMGESKTEV